MKWSEINGGNYGEFFNNDKASEENHDIQRSLARVIEDYDIVMDWGAGDGLAMRLWRESVHSEGKHTWWLPIDSDSGFKDTAVIADAKEFIDEEVDVLVCLFAAEEIGVEAVAEKVAKTRGAVIVWYHLAPLAKASWYHCRWIRWLKDIQGKNRKLKRLLEAQGIVVRELLGERGYWIAEKS